jgi:hypothetical protein
VADNMSEYRRYNEHPAAALVSVLEHLERVGASLSGIGGNDAHRFGYHLSAVRLNANGLGGDSSLRGAGNNPPADLHAACAIDIGRSAWRHHGEWLEDVRRRCAAGQLPQVAELIGDPDLLPGPAIDGVKAMYAAPSTGWRWVPYTGQGHTAWCHVSIYRRYANDDTFGDDLFAGWGPNGRQESDMGPETTFNVDRDGDGRLTPTPFKDIVGWLVGMQLEQRYRLDLINARLDELDAKK